MSSLFASGRSTRTEAQGAREMSADPKSNGERPPWYGREVSMTNGAASKKTSSITVGAVLERIRSDYWKIPVERVQFKFAKAFDKATKEGAPDPVGKAKSAVDAAKRDLPWSLLERQLL